MRNLIGPPRHASNHYVLARLLENCIECECCGAISHFKSVARKGFSIQTNVGGRVMASRRAMYMAALPNKTIRKGLRITSRCHNPNCINPDLLIQATPGQVIKMDYEKGNRCKVAVRAHLARVSREINVKLTDESVRLIREDERTGKFGAADYGITPEHFNAIKRGATRRGPNPFAGLMA